MIIPCTHDPIHKIALIRQKKQPLRVLVESSDRVDALRIMNIVDHIVFLAFFRCADNSRRLVKREQDAFFLLAYASPLKTDRLPRQHSCPGPGADSVHSDCTRLDLTVRLTS